MRLRVAGIATLFAHLALSAPQPADACGVKLTVKPSAPRKAVARSANPSNVLLVGSPPRRLEHDLTVAGHKVEVTSDPATAKRDSYAIVIVDSDQQESAARERFGNAVVIVRSGDTRADVRAVEDRVARRPVAVASARDVVGTRAKRSPVAAGPEQLPKEIVTAKPADTVEPATAPPRLAPTPAPTPTPATPTPQRVATASAANTERAVAKPAREVATTAELHEEYFFRVGSNEVAKTRALAHAVKWLADNQSVQVTIEGHADPTGNPDSNMALSQARADAVRAFLVENGIDSSRIDVKAFGDTQLKYGTHDGRNRRAAIGAIR